MSKKNFVTLIMSTLGGILFALGMCMALLPEWNAFSQGIVLGSVGVAVLLAMGIVRRRMAGKPAIVLNKRSIGAALLGIAGVIVFGVGMCLVMVWEMVLPGIVVGVAGMVLLLSLIPVIRGLK